MDLPRPERSRAEPDDDAHRFSIELDAVFKIRDDEFCSSVSPSDGFNPTPQPFLVGCDPTNSHSQKRGAEHAFLIDQLFLRCSQSLTESFPVPWHGWHAACNSSIKRDAKRFD